MENEAFAFSHTSVLLYECIDALNIRNGFTYVDATAGGGGHSLEIAKRMGPDSRLICFDKDADAIAAATKRLEGYLDRVTFVHEAFSSLGQVLKEMKIENLGGVLADLGCSSFQFDNPARGFSYMHDAPLDMRMDVRSPLTARDIVNDYSFEDLKKVIFDYGEERFAPKIASEICRRREQKPIETTFELVEIIKAALPAAAKTGGSHPCKRTFQSLRVETNKELDEIRPLIDAAVCGLVKTGRIAIISFQSLEDRIVKLGYRDHAQGCTCPRDFPVCVCGKKPEIVEVGKKPILPSETEITNNPRSRSAKLRVAEKI